MALAIVTNALNALIKPAEQAGGTLQPRGSAAGIFQEQPRRSGMSAAAAGRGRAGPAATPRRRLREHERPQATTGPGDGRRRRAREGDAAFRFGSECLLLLLALKAAMAEARASAEARRGPPPPPAARVRTGEAAPPPPLPADALGVGQTRTVQAALQFAVTLTVCPHLLPRVSRGSPCSFSASASPRDWYVCVCVFSLSLCVSVCFQKRPYFLSL
uniref:Uncharacterized protein LOC116956175 n=1 Tax=Petromyzon marinus TaxID=7757 RepID=A0AAJ7UBS8_PETMA|nr:uncharacterized protein LOC116956175 [Petromyzon marinus]